MIKVAFTSLLLLSINLNARAEGCQKYLEEFKDQWNTVQGVIAPQTLEVLSITDRLVGVSTIVLQYGPSTSTPDRRLLTLIQSERGPMEQILREKAPDVSDLEVRFSKTFENLSSCLEASQNTRCEFPMTQIEGHNSDAISTVNGIIASLRSALSAYVGMENELRAAISRNRRVNRAPVQASLDAGRSAHGQYTNYNFLTNDLNSERKRIEEMFNSCLN